MAIQEYITNGHHVDEEGRQAQPTPLRVDTDDRAPARIKVIGVGGGGCNCVKRMLRHAVPGVTFAMVNTDIKSLVMEDEAVDVVQIGEKETRGWGAGGDYKSGARAAEESSSTLRHILSDSELVFVTAGMGGGQSRHGSGVGVHSRARRWASAICSAVRNSATMSLFLTAWSRSPPEDCAAARLDQMCAST